MSNDIQINDCSQQPQKLPNAIKSGTIHIGNFNLDCAILEDGTQVVTRNSLLKLMGRSNGGGRPSKEILSLRSTFGNIPVFISANNLIPFIPKDLSKRDTPLLFIPLHGGRAHGYSASIIPDICDTYLDARLAGNVLTKKQMPIAATLEIISRGLSRVGISALVLEACGVVTSEKEYLQNILKKYINDNMIDWVRRFPKSFFDKYKQMYSVESNKRIPHHVGHFINTYIYKGLATGILEELQRLNPKNETGNRPFAHHQFLTENEGVKALDRQIVKVETLMSISNDKNKFIEYYKSM